MPQSEIKKTLLAKPLSKPEAQPAQAQANRDLFLVGQQNTGAILLDPNKRTVKPAR